MTEAAEPNAYLETVKRLEPDIAMIDTGAGWASIAISLRRIADALEARNAAQPDLWAFCDKLQSSIESGLFYGSQKK